MAKHSSDLFYSATQGIKKFSIVETQRPTRAEQLRARNPKSKADFETKAVLTLAQETGCSWEDCREVVSALIKNCNTLDPSILKSQRSSGELTEEERQETIKNFLDSSIARDIKPYKTPMDSVQESDRDQKTPSPPLTEDYEISNLLARVEQANSELHDAVEKGKIPDPLGIMDDSCVGAVGGSRPASTDQSPETEKEPVDMGAIPKKLKAKGKKSSDTQNAEKVTVSMGKALFSEPEKLSADLQKTFRDMYILENKVTAASYSLCLRSAVTDFPRVCAILEQVEAIVKCVDDKMNHAETIIISHQARIEELETEVKNNIREIAELKQSLSNFLNPQMMVFPATQPKKGAKLDPPIASGFKSKQTTSKLSKMLADQEEELSEEDGRCSEKAPNQDLVEKYITKFMNDHCYKLRTLDEEQIESISIYVSSMTDVDEDHVISVIKKMSRR